MTAMPHSTVGVLCIVIWFGEHVPRFVQGYMFVCVAVVVLYTMRDSRRPVWVYFCALEWSCLGGIYIQEESWGEVPLFWEVASDPFLLVLVRVCVMGERLQSRHHHDRTTIASGNAGGIIHIQDILIGPTVSAHGTFHHIIQTPIGTQSGRGLGAHQELGDAQLQLLRNREGWRQARTKDVTPRIRIGVVTRQASSSRKPNAVAIRFVRVGDRIALHLQHTLETVVFFHRKVHIGTIGSQFRSIVSEFLL
mmetsp:Transcript_15041/g.31015  ORF Transcript_15041/g.31015 Transcript_15041/m.31015 type:complete len:250 (+) Transcript_15041:52-801(+)